MIKFNKKIVRDIINKELEKQGKKVTVKNINDYIDSLFDSLKLTAIEYIEEDVTNNEINW